MEEVPTARYQGPNGSRPPWRSHDPRDHRNKDVPDGDGDKWGGQKLPNFKSMEIYWGDGSHDGDDGDDDDDDDDDEEDAEEYDADDG